MAQVTLGQMEEMPGVRIDSAFDNYAEAQNRAAEVFTCVIGAVGKTDSGKLYMRPVESKDSTIFAYAVIVFA